MMSSELSSKLSGDVLRSPNELLLVRVLNSGASFAKGLLIRGLQNVRLDDHFGLGMCGSLWGGLSIWND